MNELTPLNFHLQLAAATVRANLQPTATQIVPQPPVEPLSSFEPAPLATPLHDTGRGRSPVPAMLAGGVTALLAPTAAIAQTSGIENLASVVPQLPPSWQLVVGGLLYAEPAIRAFSRTVRKIFSQPHTVPPALEGINEASGKIERYVAPFRDLGLTPYIVHEALFGASQTTATQGAAVAAAFTLSLWNYFVERTTRVEGGMVWNLSKSGQVLTPEGWRRQRSRALGVFGSDVPAHFPAGDTVEEQFPQRAESAAPRFSFLRNLLGFLRTVTFLAGPARRSHNYTEGWLTTVRTYFRSWFRPKEIPVGGKFLRAADVLLPQWSMRTDESYGISPQFKNWEKIDRLPPDALIVYAAVNHASTYPDFGALKKDPRIRWAADDSNFRTNPLVRVMGLSWFLSRIAWVFVQRNSTGNHKPAVADQPDDLSAKTADWMANLGIRPAFFIQGGRTPAAYDDAGNLIEPLLYTNIPKLEYPERYFNPFGIVKTAIAAAKQNGRTVYIPLMHIEGTGLVMPKGGKWSRWTEWIRGNKWIEFFKWSKWPPFFQAVRPGRTTHSIGDIIEVRADSDPWEVGQQVIDAAKKATRVNERLRAIVARWAKDAGQDGASPAFDRLAEGTELHYTIDTRLRSDKGVVNSLVPQNELYYIVAARICCIHPSLPEREKFKKELLEIVLADGGDGKRIVQLLKEVSRVVKETEYL